MRKGPILAVGFVIFLMMATVLVNAEKKSFSAGGAVTAYVDVWTSGVVGGTWSVSVKGDTIDFRVYYLEENLQSGYPEFSPVGTVDHFNDVMTWYSTPVITGDTLTFDCTFHVQKLWCTMDGGREWYYWDTAIQHVTISPAGLYIDKPLGDDGQNWDTVGTVTHMK